MNKHANTISKINRIESFHNRLFHPDYMFVSYCDLLLNR